MKAWWYKKLSNRTKKKRNQLWSLQMSIKPINSINAGDFKNNLLYVQQAWTEKKHMCKLGNNCPIKQITSLNETKEQKIEIFGENTHFISLFIALHK